MLGAETPACVSHGLLCRTAAATGSYVSSPGDSSSSAHAHSARSSRSSNDTQLAWLALGHGTAAGPGLHHQHAVSSSRRLRQLQVCPTGCMEDACAEDAASGGLRCMKCEATLVVDRVTGLCGKQTAHQHTAWLEIVLAALSSCLEGSPGGDPTAQAAPLSGAVGGTHAAASRRKWRPLKRVLPCAASVCRVSSGQVRGCRDAHMSRLRQGFLLLGRADNARPDTCRYLLRPWHDDHWPALIQSQRLR